MIELTLAERRLKLWLNVWGIGLVVALLGLIAIPLFDLRTINNPIFYALTIGGLVGQFYVVQALRDGIRQNAYLMDSWLGLIGIATILMTVFFFLREDDKILLGLGALVGWMSSFITIGLAFSAYRYRIKEGFSSRVPSGSWPEDHVDLSQAEIRLGWWAWVVAVAAGIGLILLDQPRDDSFFVALGLSALVTVIPLAVVAGQFPARQLLIFDVIITMQLVTFIAVVGNWTGNDSGILMWILLGLTLLTGVMRLAAGRSVYSGLYIPFWLFRELVAFADVMIEGPMAQLVSQGTNTEIVSPHAVAMNVDRYLAQVKSTHKLSAMISLFFVTILRPIAGFHLPMSRMGYVERRNYIERVYEGGRGLYRRMIQIKQLVVLGYYDDPRTYPQVGFETFPQRKRYQALVDKQISVTPKAAPEIALSAIREREHRCKICVIGSGAGGAVIAARLAEAFPNGITILEAGPYIRSHEFTHSEAEMFATLYKDGGMQISMDLYMPVLQGECVGGSTVHNNGICFDLPETVRQQWESMGAKIDRAQLEASTQRIRQRLHVQPIPEAIIGPGSLKFAEGANKLKQKGLDMGRIKHGPTWFDLSLDGCLGCGYCNIGCRYGKKMSMLDTFVPDAESHGATVIANCRALRFDIEDDRIVGLRCKLDGRHDFYVHADHFIVACGTIASSILLQNSGVKGPVGKGLSFNVGTAVSAEFPDLIRGYDGVQMCGYLEADGYMLETLFNPPALFAMTMPGWFREHFRNMQHYAYFANGGVMVPSAAIGEVRQPIPVVEKLVSGYLPSFTYSLAKDEQTFKALQEGISLFSEVYLAAGASRVMPSTYVELEFRAGDDTETIRRAIRETIRTPEDLYYASAHPQGGNAINRSPEKGVIDEGFRIHSLQNGYVGDASVFPTSVQVNPQLSIMAVADYAAELMRERMIQ